MKIVLPAVLLAGLSLSVSVAAVESPLLESVDGIVAVVNEDIIPRSELNQEMEGVMARLRKRGTRLPPFRVLEKQVLERLIIKQLQLQLADSIGIRIGDNQLNSAMLKLSSRNNLNATQFRKILERDGYDYASFREEIRDQIKLSQLRQVQVDNRIQVTDREIDNFLANQQQQGATGEEFHLAHILVSIPEAASPDSIGSRRDRANGILKKLADGADFRETAVAMSDGQKALEGGDLGWRKADELPTIFAETAPKLQPGDTSEIIRSPSGFHIIHMIDSRTGNAELITQTRVRHILIRNNEETSDDDAKTRLLQLKERIESGDDFEELARSHSDDTTSAVRGGMLGWVSPGNLVPKFEQIMDTAETNAITKPFRTSFGWHILQVLDRRSHDSTEEIKRSGAREVIKERKVDEEFQSWLRGLRDEAFVEYRLDLE